MINITNQQLKMKTNSDLDIKASIFSSAVTVPTPLQKQLRINDKSLSLIFDDLMVIKNDPIIKTLIKKILNEADEENGREIAYSKYYKDDMDNTESVKIKVISLKDLFIENQRLINQINQ